MKKFLIVSFVSLFIATATFAGDNGARFPKNPNINETPGKLCSNPSSKRYPEQIAYCERDVDVYTKNAVIQKYDQLLGYSIRQMKRTEFKIDHLIPLCAGGANSEENLWPQHRSVYNVTDPLEPAVCEKMLAGKLKQAEAVKLILRAKTNLEQVSAIMKEVQSL